MAKKPIAPQQNSLPLLSQVNFLAKKEFLDFKTLAEWTSELKKLTVKQLVEWYDLADAIVSNTQEPIVVLDKNLKVIMSNPAFSEIFHIPEETFLGKDFLTLGKGFWDENTFRQSLKKTFDARSGLNNLEFERTVNQLGKRYFSLAGRPIILRGLNMRVILLTIKDITTEKELKKNQLEATVILESIGEAFIAYDKQWCITYMNKVAEKMSTKKRRQVTGKIAWEVFPKFKETDIGQALLNAAKTGESQHFETFFEMYQKWLQVDIHPITNGITVYYRDITSRKITEQQKDEFVAVVSHELKTPVTTISALIQLLIQKAEKSSDEESLQYLKRAEFYTHRLNSLISGLISSEKFRASQFQFSNKEFCIDELVVQTVEDLKSHTPTHQLTVKGKTNKKIIADPERITQVLTNLILNAIRYSPNSNQVIIKLKTEKSDVIIGVKDFGIGISKENQKRIFERFFQVTSPKRELSSVGLGLDISANIVKHYGGEIWVKSAQGKGSTFFFSLPFKKRNRTNQKKN